MYNYSRLIKGAMMQVKTITFIVSLIFSCQVYAVGKTFSCDKNNLKKLIKTPLDVLFDITVNTASQYPEHLGATPANILVITQEQIQERRYRNLLDLLQDQAGVDLYKYNDPSSLHSLSLRGLNNGRDYLILQDGIRITTPGGDNLAISDNFPLYHVKQVELLYGPAAAIYGADAFTGVINLITKIEDKPYLQLGIGQGIDQQYRYAFGETESKNGWKFAMGAHTQYEDLSQQLLDDYPDYFQTVDAVNFDGDVVIPAAERTPFRLYQQSKSAFMRLDYEDKLSINFFHSRLEHGSNVGDRPSITLYDADALWSNHINSLSVRYKTKLNSRLNTETNVQYLQHELRNTSQFKNIFTNFDSGYKYAKGEQWLFSQRFDYCWNDKQRLVGGVSYEYTDALPRTTDLPRPYNIDLDPGNQGMFYEKTDIPIQINEMNYYNIGAYLQLHSTWNDKLSSVVGLRLDKNSRYEGSLSPRLGLIYKAGTRTLIKLLYGEAFRAPSANEMLRQFGSFTGERNADGQYISNFFASPNYDLQPETLRSLELNIHHILSKNLNLQASVYYSKINNLINTRSTDDPLQFIPNAEILQGSIKDNLGNANIYGADLQLNYHTRLNSKWKMKLWGNYSYISGGIDDKNTGILADLSYISPHKLKLGATFNYGKNYFFTSKLHLISAANTPKLLPDSDNKRIQSPGYAVVNFHIGAKNVFYHKGLNFYIDIENLWDRRYFHSGGGTSSTSFKQIPQVGRRISFNFDWQF